MKNQHIDLWILVQEDFIGKLDKRIRKFELKIGKERRKLLHQVSEKERQKISTDCYPLNLRIEELKRVRKALYQELSHHVGNYCNKITSDEILEIE
jgi:hypothetical protein